MRGDTALDPPPRPGAESAGSDSGPRQRGGIRRATDDFLREFRGQLQERLRISTGFLAIVGAVLLVVSAVTGAAEYDWDFGVLLKARFYAHAGAVLVLLAAWLLLRRRALAYRILVVLDAVMMAAVVAATLTVYALDYRADPFDVPAFLALFVVARALVVPSTVRRTLFVSLPALAGILAVQLGYGVTYDASGVVLSSGTFVSRVIWNQVVLGLALGLSLLASHLNFALRMKAYEALRMDQYLLEGLLGRGGMGEVYRARHTLLRRPTALKLVHPDRAGRRNLRRFEKEVRHTCLLTHPNTIRIYDYGHTPNGEFFYAMELLEGADLQHIVDATGPMSPARAVHVLRQACAALAEAHAKGLVHRDVKPSNLMLCRQGLDDDVVKVLDFGLVKETGGSDPDLTRAGEVCGTPSTIAPETLRGAVVTAQADLYSLGAVGCFLLTGRPIFEAKSPMEFAVKHVSDEPMAPSKRGVEVPEDLENLLLRCLEKDPGERPDGAVALAAELDACDNAGHWTQADAKRWWEAHRERLAEARPRSDGEDEDLSSPS
jgi:serine/threonine-protein kinase